MAKVDKEFNLKDWEWIAVHFPKSERETMARVAWLVCSKCTPEEIYQYNLDPRIVIPLCAILLLDKKDFLELKNFPKSKEKEIDSYLAILEKSERKQENYNRVKQEFINPAINSINPSKKWLSLFQTLDIYLQFSLLYSFIKYRRITRNDWRNIFLDIENLSINFYFLVVLIISLRVIMISDNQLNSSTIKQIILLFLLLSGLLLWIVLLFIFFWKTTLLVKIISLVACSILWIYGQNIYRKLTNPLRKIFQSNISRSLANLDRFNN
ncbi:hypothetical protein [Okeania sp.]|uniref:hypothetical protein n=1 Tax=Okeania sp. TaxID=3100323 RepID=UPI002B4AF276|nr:hypothetical protein [Okeania sp.]MEB3339259.1 hypothetical protein [Okeania sp.]